MAPTWYLGPLGDLRPLECPSVDIAMPVVRYGGVHQGLSGARTMDVTGRRQDFELEFSYMTQAEYAWLELLYLGHINGPYRLINPMKKNRLTPEAGAGMVWRGSSRGVEITAGVATRVFDWPAAAGIGGMSTKWTNRSGISVMRFDSLRWTPLVQPLETVTGSVWMKGSAAASGTFGFDWYDRNDEQLSGTVSEVINLTTDWVRYDITASAVATATGCNLFFYTSDTAADIYFTAAQVEEGSILTDYETGGGAPMVLIDQMPTSSPFFPLTDVTVTLLEA